MELSQEQIIAILGVLLAISELIALNPKYEANSVLQIVRNILKRILGKKKEEPKKDVEDIVEDIAKEALIEAIKDEIDKHK
jgi:hypothetical protein